MADRVWGRVLRGVLAGAGLTVASFAAVSSLSDQRAGADQIPTITPPDLVVTVADPSDPAAPAAVKPTPAAATPSVASPAATPVPPAPTPGAAGRRVVYSNSQQRVWAYEADGALVRTYAVSGRRGVPRPGDYRVFSRSASTRSGSGAATMRWMVRFARGSRLSIGFHEIPVGRRGPIQSNRELGQFRSLGCVRQSTADAKFLWDFAPLGTRVTVLR